MVFQYTSPTELLLPIEASVQERAERQSQQLSETARWAAYLNAICLETVLPWLQAEYSDQAQVWLADELPALWGVVNGVAIVLDNKRFVLIPSKEVVMLQFTVPQEWIDLPIWAGDYFLPVQIDPIEQWLKIGGYATHAQIKTEGEYWANDRTYALDMMQIVTDISALAVMYQLNPQEQTQAAIQPLPTLDNSQIESLLQTLSCSRTTPLNQQIPFEQWGELLKHPEIRQRLYVLCSPSLTLLNQAEPASDRPMPIVHLMNWLQQQFESGWESIDRLLNAEARLAFNLRHSPDGAICRARTIRLAADHAVTLVVMLESESRSKPSEAAPPQIQVRLYPGDRPFPEDLSLALLAPDGTLVQRVQASPEANFIQLKRFRCRPGKSFRVQIAMAVSEGGTAAQSPIFTEQFIG